MRNPYSIPLTSCTGSAYSFPTTLAMSTDGKHAFLHVYDVEGGGMTVSIIDTDLESPTYNAETYMTERYSAVSPDGTRLYVPELDGKTSPCTTRRRTPRSDPSSPTTSRIRVSEASTLLRTERSTSPILGITRSTP